MKYFHKRQTHTHWYVQKHYCPPSPSSSGNCAVSKGLSDFIHQFALFFLLLLLLFGFLASVKKTSACRLQHIYIFAFGVRLYDATMALLRSDFSAVSSSVTNGLSNWRCFGLQFVCLHVVSLVVWAKLPNRREKVQTSGCDTRAWHTLMVHADQRSMLQPERHHIIGAWQTSFWFITWQWENGKLLVLCDMKRHGELTSSEVIP